MTIHSYANSPGDLLPSYLPVASFVRGKIEDGAIPITAICLAVLAGMAFVYWDQRHQPNFYKNAAYLISGITLAGGGYWVLQNGLFPKKPHDPFLHQDVFDALTLLQADGNIHEKDSETFNSLLASITERPGGLASLRDFCDVTSTRSVLYIDQNGMKRKASRSDLGLSQESHAHLQYLEQRACIHALCIFGDKYLQQLATRFADASKKASQRLPLTKEEKISLAEIVWLKDRLPLDQDAWDERALNGLSQATRAAASYLHAQLRRYHRCEDWSSGDLALFHHHRSRQVTQVKHEWSSPLASLIDLIAFILPESWVGHDYHTQVFFKDEEQHPKVGHLTNRWQVDDFGLSQRLRCRHVAVAPPQSDNNMQEAFSRHIQTLCLTDHPRVGISAFTSISCALPRFGQVFKNNTNTQVLQICNGRNTTSISGSCTTLPYYIHNTARNNAQIASPVLQAHTRPSGLYGGRYAKELKKKGWVDEQRIDILEAIIDWEPSVVEKIHHIVNLPLSFLGF